MSRYRNASSGDFNQITNEDLQIEVVMVDGTTLFVVLEPNTIGQQLFDSICESVNLVEKEYFGLVYGLSEDGTRHWLDLSKPVKKFVKSPYILSCEVKFYPQDPDLVQDVLTQNYIYYQVKKDLLNSRIEASFSTYALLGSFMVQHEYGDHNKNATNFVKNTLFAPSHYQEIETLQKKVLQLHRSLKGMSATDAQLLYLQNAKKLHLYGVHLRKVVNENGEYVKLGVCASGILVLKENQQIDYKFSWPKVNKVCCQNCNFYIKVKSSFERENGIHWFMFHSTSSARKFFLNCKEHHKFFRRSMQSNENIFDSTYDTIYDNVENEILQRSGENLLEYSDYGSLNPNDKGMSISNNNLFDTQTMEDNQSSNIRDHQNLYFQEDEVPEYELSYEEASEIENNSMEKQSILSGDTCLQEHFQNHENSLSYISENEECDEELNQITSKDYLSEAEDKYSTNNVEGTVKSQNKGLNEESENINAETAELLRQLQDALNNEYLLSEEKAAPSNDFLDEEPNNYLYSEKEAQEKAEYDDFSTKLRESEESKNCISETNVSIDGECLVDDLKNYITESRDTLNNDENNTYSDDEFPPPPEIDEEINEDDLIYGSSNTVYETPTNSPYYENSKEEEWSTPTEELQINFPSTHSNLNNEDNPNYDVDLDKAILDAVGFDTDKTVDEKFKRSYSFRIKLQTNEP